MRFNRVRRAANIVIVALLLFLFFVPELYLSRTADALTEQLTLAEQAAERDDIPAAQTALLELKTRSDHAVPPLKLFMDHTGVDALILAIAAAQPMEEREDILSATAGIRAGIEQLREIECFSFKTLL